MGEPTPPDDEPWQIWHRAASEQAATVASGLTSDPLPTLARARDFAVRALRQANPLEEIFTKSLIDGIDRVEGVLKDYDWPGIYA